MRVGLVFTFGLTAVLAAHIPDHTDTAINPGSRIVGGTPVNITQYPYTVALLLNKNGVFKQACVGTIINNRSVLTAGHCFDYVTNAVLWRSRVGSSYAHSGGIVYDAARIIKHDLYRPELTGKDNDFAVIRIFGQFVWSNTVQDVAIATPNYFVGPNYLVWTAGWGYTTENGQPSEQLRHVDTYIIDQWTCEMIYYGGLTQNMICSGRLNVGGSGQCEGDSGSPLIHNSIQYPVLVGVFSWTLGCGRPDYPAVSSRVSNAYFWIVANI